jgi:putative ABC transport system ATP-binding protein
MTNTALPTGETVTCSDLRHHYEVDGKNILALDGIDLDVPAGTSAAIIGPSGSGKSTLLTLLAGLQRPTYGTIHLGNTNLTASTERELLHVRATRLAVVAQNPYRNLLPYGTCVDNLTFAQRAPRSHGRRNLPPIEPLLRDLGLMLVANTRCDKLSGGERQRLALAAALATGPTVLVTDEPTSQLDDANRTRVAELLTALSAARGITLIAFTHDTVLAGCLDRTITLHDGRISA